MAHEPPEYYRKQPGDLVICTHGRFSDYTLEGVFRITRAVDLAQEVRTFYDQIAPEDDWGKYYRPSACIRALLARGILEPVAAAEIFFGETSDHGMPDWMPGQEDEGW